MESNFSVESDQLDGSLPDLSASISSDELDGSVDIWRDQYGIPHMKASTTHDAFFVQGFVHAQDRLWQMEFDRRRACGRWSEVVGKSGLLFDRFARRVGITDSAKRDYEHFNDETRAMVDAYAAGVNAYIESTDRLPVEYSITGIAAEPWEPWHSSAVFKVRHILMGTGLAKLLRARMLVGIGPEMAMRMRSEAYDSQVLIVPPGEEYEGMIEEISDLDPGKDAISRLGELESGSNNWAVHGSRTASGKPLVAGDPHRALDVPNVYYQNHLACPEFDVIGFSFCGVPGFPHFAHNEHVAWGITHAAADYQDLYVEHFHPSRPYQYEYKRDWVDADHHTEQIQIRGEDPVDVEVVKTRNGHVVFGDPLEGPAISFRYSALVEPNAGFQCLLPMLKANSVEELDESMRDWVDPCNNLVMGDVHGTIGYLTRGQLPVRSRANGWLPVPGWDGEHDWTGVVPFEELPRVRNPETGWVATANNRIVGNDYPHYIALDFAPDSRARRIYGRLQDISGATVEDMAGIHADRVSLPSRIFVDKLAAAAEQAARSDPAIEMLEQWDGGMEKDSPEAALYIALRNQLTVITADLPAFASLKHNPFAAEEPPLVGPIGLLYWIVPQFLTGNDESLLPDGTTWNDLLLQAFDAATAELSERLGDDPAGWSWAAIHRTAPTHPLALVSADLGEALNPPSVTIGGDSDTPQAAGIYPGVSYNVAGTSVARYIFDTADWENSRWIVPLGSSGHPGSPHYADQADRWSNVDYIPMTYSWETIESQAENHQQLTAE
ncbi:MAG: penicillin acylase family protein [Thermomicrobiales bacterium]